MRLRLRRTRCECDGSGRAQEGYASSIPSLNRTAVSLPRGVVTARAAYEPSTFRR